MFAAIGGKVGSAHGNLEKQRDTYQASLVKLEKQGFLARLLWLGSSLS